MMNIFLLVDIKRKKLINYSNFKMRIDELIRCGKIEVSEEVEEQNLMKK